MRRLPLLAALLALLAGCDGFLEEDIRSNPTDVNLAPSREGLEAAALYLQVVARDVSEANRREVALITGASTDDQIVGSGSASRQEIDLLTFDANNNEVERAYTEHTEAIARTNAVIQLARDSGVGDEAFVRGIEAEARFYRAHVYLRLVQLFGPVPVIREAYDVTQGPPNFTQAPVEEVYAFIGDDLAYARENLPETRPAGERGRPTADAARMIAARAALAQGRFGDAAAAAREVVAGGRHELFPDYLSLFHYAGETASEHILQVVLGPTSQGLVVNFLGVDFTPGSGNPTGQTGFTNHAMTPDLADAFPEGDARRGSFFDDGFLLDGEPQETRYGLPYTLKYVDPSLPQASGGGLRTQNYVDYSLIRYAETLLTLAEAVNETDGPTAEAYGAVNEVRARAELDPLPAGLSQGAFREAVRAERRLELYFEGLRWFDLKRYGFDVFKSEIESSQATRNLVPVTGVEPKHLLYPIPASEIAVTGFEQNPGY